MKITYLNSILTDHSDSLLCFAVISNDLVATGKFYLFIYFSKKIIKNKGSKDGSIGLYNLFTS